LLFIIINYHHMTPEEKQARIAALTAIQATRSLTEEEAQELAALEAPNT